MRKLIRFFWAFLLATASAVAQNADTPANQVSTEPEKAREVSWKRIVPNFAEDQKQIWLFPFHVAQGKHLLPTIGVISATAAIVAGVDPPSAKYFRENESSYHTFNQIFRGTTSTAEILAVPTAFYLVGLTQRDSYTKDTALLAAEAIADVEVPNVALRAATRRLRPIDVPTNGNFSDTWFDSGSNPLKAQGSFASGHAASAFAVATVIARRYSKHKWVPYVAYGAAGVIAFSRVSNSAHFASDALFGSAMGYTVGRFVVLRE